MADPTFPGGRHSMPRKLHPLGFDALLKLTFLGLAARAADSREGRQRRLFIGGKNCVEGSDILFVQLSPVREIPVECIATSLGRGLNGVCRTHVGGLHAKDEPR